MIAFEHVHGWVARRTEMITRRARGIAVASDEIPLDVGAVHGACASTRELVFARG